MIDFLMWVAVVFLSIIAVYVFCRVGSSAVFRSWWESKKEFEDKEGGN